MLGVCVIFVDIEKNRTDCFSSCRRLSCFTRTAAFAKIPLITTFLRRVTQEVSR